MFDYAPYFYLGYLCIIASIGAMVPPLAARYSLKSRLKPLWSAVLPALVVIAIPLAAASALLINRLPDAGDKSTILVVSATYGENVKAPAGNATDKLRRACNGREACEYRVDVNILGDPAGGVGKNFMVEYECPHIMKPVREVIPAEAHNRKIVLDCKV